MNTKINKISDTIIKHKSLVQNFSYLSVIQVLNIAIPLLSYPYLIRVIGTDTYGLVVFAQVTLSYFGIIVNYGFNISATKDISINRDNKSSVNEIVSTVFLIKGLLFLISVASSFLIVKIIPTARGYEMLFFLTLWMPFYNFIFPVWYFQGIERMKYITLVTLIARLTFLGLIFVFIKSQSDYLYIPALNGLGALLSGFASLYIIFRLHKVKFIIPSRNTIRKQFKESSVLFVSRISSFRDNTPLFLIGLFVSNEAAAYYDLVNKVIRIVISFFDNVTNVMFPRIANNKNPNFNRRIIKLELIAIIVFYILLIAGSKTIILILGGKEMLPAQPLFYILGFLLLRPFSALIGTTILVTNNLAKEFSLNLIYSTIFYFIITLLLFPVNMVNTYSLAITLVAALAFQLLHRIFYIHKYKLTKWLY
ncbi:MAG: oligosaccharide flippase family protein [Bacteroidota bacterium]